MVDNLLEGLGFCLLVAFAYFVWPPAALLAAGLVLLLMSNVRSARKAAKDGKKAPGFAERVVRAWLSARAEQR